MLIFPAPVKNNHIRIKTYKTSGTKGEQYTPTDLIFTTLEVVSIGFAVWIVTMIAHDGESNWIVSNSTGIIMKTYQRIIRHSMLTSLK